MAGDDQQTNSMCAVYATLIENQLRSSDTDMETVFELLGYIKRYCQTVASEPGEVPDHLEEHLFEEGEGEGVTGTVEVDGVEIPRVAAEKRE